MHNYLMLTILCSFLFGCVEGASTPLINEPIDRQPENPVPTPIQAPGAFNLYSPIVALGSHLVSFEWEISSDADAYTVCNKVADSSCDALVTTTATTYDFNLHVLSGISNKEYLIEATNRAGMQRSNSIELTNTLLMEASSIVLGKAGDTHSSYGMSIDISSNGKRAIIGTGNIDHSDGTSSIYIYEYLDGIWTETLKHTYTGPNVWTGTGVAISGDGKTIAYNHDQHDEVAVYHNDGSGWTIVDTHRTLDNTREFGISLALSYNGQVLAIGDKKSGSSVAPDQIHIAVYDSNFNRLHVITEEDSSAIVDSDLGQSIDISHDGNTIIAGSPGIHKTGTPADTGGAIVYTTDDNWEHNAAQIFFIKDQGEYVRISGDGKRVCLGSTSSKEITCQTFDGYSTFHLTSLGSSAASDLWGASFDLNNDGSLIVVSNYADDTHSLSEKGFIEVIDLSSSPALLYELNANTHDILEYGYSIALSSDGNALLIGAPGNKHRAAGKTPTVFSY